MTTENKAMVCSFAACLIVITLSFLVACMFVVSNTTNDQTAIRIVCILIACSWSMVLGFAVQHDVEWRIRGWH